MVAKSSGASRSGARKTPPEPHAEGAAHAANHETRQLDRLIHDRIRLGIMSALAGSESLSFGELKELLQTTDGNLSVHARKLEEAQYIACAKSFEGRVPRTRFRLTPAGRRAFESYLNHMEALIRVMRRKSG